MQLCSSENLKCTRLFKKLPTCYVTIKCITGFWALCLSQMNSVYSTTHYYSKINFTPSLGGAIACSVWWLRYGLDGPGSNRGRVKKLFSSSNRPDRFWHITSLLFNGSRGPFSGAKRPALDVDHSPSSNAEVKSEYSYTSTPPIYIHGVDRDRFYFIPPSSQVSVCIPQL
jgi:hypothetical protein